MTVARRTYTLRPPFFVLATQNPIEQEGTYPLPEAQLDRFMFLIELDYPSRDEEIEIARTTTGDAAAAERGDARRRAGCRPSRSRAADVPVPDHLL